ncbi:MAG: hypothetical protein PHE55_16720 [Methylococcaceae bacterium]|nr:hypothetical protein [Methylococcaceae bacterium]
MIDSKREFADFEFRSVDLKFEIAGLKLHPGDLKPVLADFRFDFWLLSPLLPN